MRLGAFLGAYSRSGNLLPINIKYLLASFESSPGTSGRSDFIMRQRPGRLGRVAEKLLTYEPLTIERLRSSR